jgi:benzoyl-CoA reductase/2-hydroxyglutaryl-CoA dehydratase subunit BcrC/BadD/HgdB
MKKLISDITDLHKNRFELLKASSSPKIGWLSIYTPEEILYATGMIPYRITGETFPKVSKAPGYMHRNICPYVLSCLDEVLDGVHDFSDGVIIANACDARRRLFDVWRHFRNKDFVHMLDLPKCVEPATKELFILEIHYLIETIEKRYSIKISEAALKEAIFLCNKTRELIQKLYEFRKNGCSSLTGAQYMNITKASMTGLKKEFNQKLSLLLEQLSKSDKIDTSKPRVMICGSYFDHVHIVELIEKMGAVVVCEDISNGVKYFQGTVDTEKEPVKALADYYLDKATCARMIDSQKRFENIWRLIKDYNVNSVIYVSLKFCDSNLIDFHYQKKHLIEKKIPVLFLETERFVSNMGQIQTRIQAFFESLLL